MYRKRSPSFFGIIHLQNTTLVQINSQIVSLTGVPPQCYTFFMRNGSIRTIEIFNVLKRLNIQANVDSCSMGEAKSSIGNYNLILASIHIAKELDSSKATIIGLLNLLDEKELEQKLKENGIA